jgi:hypothetical protein
MLMATKRRYVRLFNAHLALILAAALTLVSCGGAAVTPTPPPIVQPTTQPTAAPQPTVQPILSFEVNPGKEVPVGKSVAIVAGVEPLDKLDLTWTVTGTSGGKLNATTGEQVVYTAGNVEGTDIVVAEGKTASGALVKQTVTMTVVGAPAPAPTTAPTQAPVAGEMPTTVATAATSATSAPTAGGVTLTSLQDGQTYPCQNLARGAYSKEIIGHIWPLVFIDGKYYPQDEGGGAPQMLSDGTWFSNVRFGVCDTNDDVGKIFQLVIVTANEEAHKAFLAWLDRGSKRNIWTGLTELPAGVTEHRRIFINRK